MKYLALLTFLLFVLLTQSAIIECAPSDPINNRSNSPDRPPRPSPDN